MAERQVQWLTVFVQQQEKLASGRLLGCGQHAAAAAAVARAAPVVLPVVRWANKKLVEPMAVPAVSFEYKVRGRQRSLRFTAAHARCRSKDAQLPVPW
jgi:hypothetical protein